MHSDAQIPTAQARRYLGQFVKHFAHKLPFALLETNESGEVRFPAGLCLLTADDAALNLALTADDPAEMARLQDVVERHLVRFAFREKLPIAWKEREVLPS